MVVNKKGDAVDTDILYQRVDECVVSFKGWSTAFGYRSTPFDVRRSKVAKPRDDGELRRNGPV